MSAAARPTGRHVLVVGGGIAGLTAAHRLLERGAQVTLWESASRLGGKLRTGVIAGCQVDLGAESMLARRPEAVRLAHAVGLGDALRPPAVSKAAIWTRDALRPMPRGHLRGVPGDPAVLRGVISEAGLSRIAQDEVLPRTVLGEDPAIGTYVAARLGREVVDRLVEPLLSGVYAGNAYQISMRAAMPELYQAVRTERSLLAAVRDIQRRTEASGASMGPVFTGIAGGVGRLPLAVADACRAAGARIETGSPVRELHRAADGWRAVREDGLERYADAVVLAVPAPVAGRLLASEAPLAARRLASVEYASMALVTLAFRRSELGPGWPGGSGFLVPPVDGRTIKAATFSGHKWHWVGAQDPELFVLRASIGRFGEEERLEREDGELVADTLDDLRTATGLSAPPVAALVTRWDAGLPQYLVGHLARVAQTRTLLAKLPGLALCGAAYDGVGIASCVASAQDAADDILATPPLGGR